VSHREAAFTIGHSTRSVQEFIALLWAHHVELVIDVRTVPRSRRNPQFNRETLPQSLQEADVGYEHAAELGGFRRPSPDSANDGWRNASFRGYADYMQTAPFAVAIEKLAERVHRQRLAVMCAEAVPWRCHRSLIADALIARGISVEEIISTTRTQPHAMTSFARVEGTTVTYPG
jgi:uncharacterized protein (DUF488 family)